MANKSSWVNDYYKNLDANEEKDRKTVLSKSQKQPAQNSSLLGSVLSSPKVEAKPQSGLVSSLGMGVKPLPFLEQLKKNSGVMNPIMNINPADSRPIINPNIPQTPEQIQAKKNLDSFNSTPLPAIGSAMTSALYGGSSIVGGPLLLKKQQEDMQRKAQMFGDNVPNIYEDAEKAKAEHPWLYLGGQIGASLVPGAKLSGAIAKSSLGAALSTLPRATGMAAQGMIEGSLFGGSEGFFSSLKDNKPIIQGVGEGMYNGALMGGALGGIFGKVTAKSAAFKESAKKARQSIDNYNFPQLREPNVLPLPESMARGPRVSAEIPQQYRQPLPKSNEPLMLNSPKGTYLKPLEQQKTFKAKLVDTPTTETNIALKNKPTTLKGDVSPSEYSNMSREDLVQLKKDMLNEKGRIFSEQLDFLNSKASRGNKPNQGGVGKDSEGYVTNRFGRISNNELWYRNWAKENSVWDDVNKKWIYRKPTGNEIKEIAEKQLLEGFDSNGGKIPKDGYYAELSDRINKLDEVMNSPSNKYPSNVNVKQVIPYEVTTLSKKPSFSIGEKLDDLKLSKDKKNPLYVEPKFKKEIAGDPTRPTRPTIVEKSAFPIPQVKSEVAKPTIKTTAASEVPTAPKGKHSPEVQAKLDTLEAKYQQRVANQKKFNFLDPQTQSKKLKGYAMEHSAQKQALNASKNEPSINSPSKVIEPIKPQPVANNVVADANVVTTPRNNLNNVESGVTKERKFISNSYLESDVPTAKMKGEMKTKIPTYNEITNQKTLDEANRLIGNDIDKYAREFLDNPELGNAIDTAKGISLIQKAIAKGDNILANDISVNLAEKLTTAGQTVQAASIFKRMTPEGMLNYANKQINKYNSVNPTKKISGLTETETNKIVENMKLINAANNGELKLLNVNLQLFAETKLAEIFKLIGNKIPADMGQKLKALQRINLLLNPKTMIRNLSGNTILATAGNVSDTIRAGLDKGISKITGKRTALMPNIKEQFKGAKKGFQRVKSDWTNDVNTAPTGTQYELGQGQNAASPFKNKPLKFLDKVTTTGLRLADDPFYQGLYDDALTQRMKLEGVKTPTPEMIKHAYQVARERTFQDTNNITKAFSRLQQGLNRLVGTKNFGLGNIVLPFVKTPANILARALEYSPVEIGKGITKALIDAGKGNAFNQYKFVDSLAKGLTGTSIIGAGYALAEKGIITGNAPKDTDTRKYMETNGILPYSFKVGDGSYTYDWAQPSSIPLAVGADIYYNLKDKKNATDTLLAAGESGLQTLMSQSLVQGLTRFFGNNQYGSSMGDNLIKTGLGAAAQFVPLTSLSRQVAEITDKNKRNTYDDNSVVNSNLINPVKNTIPGLRQTLPVKVNSYGEKTPASGIFNTALNPAREGIGTKIDSKVSDELLRLSKVGENKQFPSLGKKSINYKLSSKSESQKLNLTPSQLSEYQQTLGKSNLQAIQSIMNSSEYKSANDKDKADMISSAMSKAKQAVETGFLKGQGINEYKSSSSSGRTAGRHPGRMTRQGR